MFYKRWDSLFTNLDLIFMKANKEGCMDVGSGVHGEESYKT